MVSDFYREIASSVNTTIHVKNIDAFNKKICEIIAGGPRNLYIVSDFDKTITKRYHNGENHVTSFGTFAYCKSTPKRYVEDEVELNKKYRPLENSTSITYEEKVKYMEEWWQKSENILKGLTVPPSEIHEAVKRIGSTLRDGTYETFNLLKEAGVPILIFSAGLGDIIACALKIHRIDLPNVKIVANFLKYGEDGQILGFKHSPIQIYNKNEAVLKDFNYEQFIANRHNTIVMGDSLGDATMSEGHPEAGGIVLKIGFLDLEVEKNLPLYMDAFDIVLINDETMDVINMILKFI